MKIRYKLRRYGFLKFCVLDNYTNALLRDDEGQLILFDSKEEVKAYIDQLEDQK